MIYGKKAAKKSEVGNWRSDFGDFDYNGYYCWDIDEESCFSE